MSTSHETEVALLKLQLQHIHENHESLKQELNKVEGAVTNLNNTLLRYKGAGAALAMLGSGIVSAVTALVTIFFSK